MNKLIIITGVSGSGKTTLQNRMLEKGYSRPINFTTRKPRTAQAEYELYGDGILGEDFTAEELEEYIFISRNNFVRKLEKGDFLECSVGYGDMYGVSKILPEGDICIVLDTFGRDQVINKYIREGLDYDVKTIFLSINEKTQRKRLKSRGDSIKQMEKRVKDFKVFYPSPFCKILDGTKNIDVLIQEIEKDEF